MISCNAKNALSHIKIGSKKALNPRNIARGLVRSNVERDYAAAAFFFLRQPSRPNPTRPEAKSGRAAGRGTAEDHCETSPKSPIAQPPVVLVAHQLPDANDRKKGSNAAKSISTFAGPGRFCKFPVIEKIPPGGGKRGSVGAPLNDRESRFEV
jgi:hypothetical protein